MNDVVDLKNYMHRNANIYSGRDCGKNARKDLNIDEKDNDENTYMVLLNKRTTLVASSFFLGLFGISVRKLGKNKFSSKYKFNLKDFSENEARIIDQDIKDYIDKAVKEVLFYV